jgi:hypothetical protein
MGARYRGLESKAGAAIPDELKAFAHEMAELGDTMKHPTRFDPKDAKKVPTIDYPEEHAEATPSAFQVDSVEAVKPSKEDRISQLLETFLGASTLTLKRVLSEEAIRKFEECKADPGAMAKWYAELALRMNQKHVDFGLPLRVKSDFDFHFKFARSMPVDRVMWEVLNRYHRYLNSFEGK